MLSQSFAAISSKKLSLFIVILKILVNEIMKRLCKALNITKNYLITR